MSLQICNVEERKRLIREEPTIEGEIIRLEGLGLRHLSKEYADWLNDKEVCRDNRHARVHNTLKMTAEYVKSVDKSDNIAAFAIIAKKEKAHIGNISLINISWENNSGEISILIGNKLFWGKGIATEAYRLVIDYAFNALNFHRLAAGMTVRNIAMQKVAEKVGMLKEGVFKEAFFKDGAYLDVIRYAIINLEREGECK